MSTIGKRKIWAGPADGANVHPLTFEGTADDSILPGKICIPTATGLKLGDAAGTVFGIQQLVAMEYGIHTGQDVDTAYAAGDLVKAVQPRSGEFVNVYVAAGVNLGTLGIGLAADGTGNLAIAATDGSEDVLFYNDEVVNVTGSPALVRVRKA